MNASTGLQWFIVTAVVAASAFHAFGIFAPRVRTRALQTLGGWLARERHPQWMRSAGQYLAPATPVAAGCGSGCGSCDGCGSTAKPSAPPVSQPMVFTRNARSSSAVQQEDRQSRN